MKDNEIYGRGNAYSAEYWEYDARLLRRWNTDPITYDWQSTYACFNNNPIYYADPLGLEGINDPPGGEKDKNGKSKDSREAASGRADAPGTQYSSDGNLRGVGETIQYFDSKCDCYLPLNRQSPKAENGTKGIVETVGDAIVESIPHVRIYNGIRNKKYGDAALALFPGPEMIYEELAAPYKIANHVSKGEYADATGVAVNQVVTGVTILMGARAPKGSGKIITETAKRTFIKEVEANAAKEGNDIALGLTGDLFKFAESKGFQTYRNFSTGFQKEKILSTIENSGNNLHFNLTDFSRYRFSKFNPNGIINHGNITNWELHTILNNPNALQRTTFYRFSNGSYNIVQNPFK